MKRNKKTASTCNMDACAVIVEIVSEHADIAGIRAFEVQAAPLLQERLIPSSDEANVIEAALRLKARYNMPFWEGVLLSCFNAQQPPSRLLRAATYHNPSTRDPIFIARDVLTVDYLQNLVRESIDDRVLVISSMIDLRDGSQRHLPMLDFHCPASPENLELTCAVVQELSIGDGFVLESGDSYHFYGERVLDESEMIRFLGRALLFAPIIDRAWIAHQLIESACALRISPRAENARAPYVVAKITSQNPLSDKAFIS